MVTSLIRFDVLLYRNLATPKCSNTARVKPLQALVFKLSMTTPPPKSPYQRSYTDDLWQTNCNSTDLGLDLSVARRLAKAAYQ
jgi:hypothetical protein